MYKAFIGLMLASMLSGCATGRWYASDYLGNLTPIKEPAFIDYKTHCVQLNQFDTTINGAIYMVEKIHITSPRELVSTESFKRCPYQFVKNN